MKSKRTLFIAQTALLAAIVILLSVPPFNLLRIGPFFISFAPIPIVIGAITSGKASGAILGTVFGLSSFMLCVTGAEPLGLMLFEISPLKIFIVCVVTRFLMGFITGVIADALRGKKNIQYLIPAIAGPILNTILFTSTLLLCFWGEMADGKTQGILNFFIVFFSFITVNAVIEALSSAFLGSGIAKALSKVRIGVPK